MSDRDAAPHSPAISALMSCVREDPTQRLEEHITAAARAGEDFSSVAATNRLASLVWMSLLEADLYRRLPEAQWRGLFDAHVATATWQNRQLAAAAEVLRALEGAGIKQALPIKGLALSALWWPDSPPRYMHDLDFLLASEHLDRATEALHQAGFASASRGRLLVKLRPHVPVLIGSGALVELHWTLWTPGYGLFSRSPSFTALYDRAVEGRLDGQTLRVPSSEDSLLTRVATLAIDGFYVPLGQWADIFWLATQRWSPLDEDRLWSIADSLGLRGILQVALQFVGEMFGVTDDGGLLSTTADQEVYGRLRPILWDRSFRPATENEAEAMARQRLATYVLTGGARRWGRDGEEAALPAAASPGEASGLGRVVTRGLLPVAAGARVLRYTGRMLLSGKQRRQFHKELIVSRLLLRLVEGERSQG